VSDIVVRRAVPTDAPGLWALSRAAILTSAAEHYTEAQLQSWAGRPTLERHRLMIESTTVLVAELDGRIAGFTNLVVDDGAIVSDGEVDQLFVEPNAGGRGVARALLEAIAEEGLTEGLSELNARASWRAVGVFERLGYQRVTVEHVEFDGEVYGRVHVRRLLAPSGGLRDVS